MIPYWESEGLVNYDSAPDTDRDWLESIVEAVGERLTNPTRHSTTDPLFPLLTIMNMIRKQSRNGGVVQMRRNRNPVKC